MMRISELVRFLKDTRGVAAIEAALLVPLYIVVLFLFKEAIGIYQMEGATHRATASVADVIANQRMAEGYSVQDALTEISGEDLNKMFREMAAGSSDSEEGGDEASGVQTGLRITFYSTAKDTNEEVSYSYGEVACQNEAAGSLKSKATPGRGGLVTSNNRGLLNLVRVEGCVQIPQTTVKSLVFPTNFTSSFIAVRREG